MIQNPDDLNDLDGFGPNRSGPLYGQEPPEPEPTPLPPAVVRTLIAGIAVGAAACAWYTHGWIQLAGIAFAVLFGCLAVMPARRQR